MPGADLILELLKTYPSLDAIPENVLEEHRLIRKMTDGVIRLVPRGRIDAKAAAKAAREALAHSQATILAPVLKKYEDYFFANDLEVLEEMCQGTRLLSEKFVERARRHAERFRNAGFPPIFKREFVGHTLDGADYFRDGKCIGTIHTFPTIDFIIQYGAGSFEKRQIARALEFAEHHGGRAGEHGAVAMSHCTVKEAETFLVMAFDGQGSILLPFIREVLHHMNTYFHFKSIEGREKALRQTEAALVFLEHSLRSMALEKKRCYKAWEGDPSIVSERRWYYAYHPNDHPRIAAAYFSTVGALSSAKELRTFERMCALFPEMAIPKSQLKIQALDADIVRAVQELDFRYLPHELFTDECPDARVREAAIAHVTQQCWKWVRERDHILLDRMYPISRALKIPRHIFDLGAFRRPLFAARLAFLQTLSDREFAEKFSDHAGSRHISGMAMFAGDPHGGDEFWNYVRTRSKEIP